jgi:hypothetical protein
MISIGEPLSLSAISSQQLDLARGRAAQDSRIRFKSFNMVFRLKI